jgi:hypothetical protein
MGFQGKFNSFLLQLINKKPAKFEIPKEKFAPMLMNPINSRQRADIIFHLLLHGGFLTQTSREVDHFKIPNSELLAVFDEQLQDYLNKFPIDEMKLTSLA